MGPWLCGWSPGWGVLRGRWGGAPRRTNGSCGAWWARRRPPPDSHTPRDWGLQSSWALGHPPSAGRMGPSTGLSIISSWARPLLLSPPASLPAVLWVGVLAMGVLQVWAWPHLPPSSGHLWPESERPRSPTQVPGPLNLSLAALWFCPQGSWMGPRLPTGLTRVPHMPRKQWDPPANWSPTVGTWESFSRKQWGTGGLGWGGGGQGAYCQRGERRLEGTGW